MLFIFSLSIECFVSVRVIELFDEGVFLVVVKIESNVVDVDNLGSRVGLINDVDKVI